MGAETRIEWADSTFNPWVGCTPVSPGCTHCYAESFGRRLGVEWGPGKPRRRRLLDGRTWDEVPS